MEVESQCSFHLYAVTWRDRICRRTVVGDTVSTLRRKNVDERVGTCIIHTTPITTKIQATKNSKRHITVMPGAELTTTALNAVMTEVRVWPMNSSQYH